MDKSDRGQGGGLPRLDADDDLAGREATETTELVSSPPPSLLREGGPATQRDRAYLVVLVGPNVGQMFRLSKSEMTLGRSSKADIRLDDERVSRLHAKLVIEHDVVTLEDLGSSNGLQVNAVKTERHELKDGDKIEIGATIILKFTYNDLLDEKFHHQLYEAAVHDGLTGAYNRRYLIHRLDSELAYARRHAAELAVLMIDLDYFKRVNDVHGHPAGDHLLVRFTELTSSTLRTEDVLARYGGEEFAVICRAASLDTAARLAERLRGLVEQYVFDFQGTPIPLSVSIGAASFPELRVGSGAELIAAADAALYRAKRSGRNRVVLASALTARQP